MDSIYAAPKVVDDLKDCIFYHTMEIPGYGTVEGHWDLRADPAAYLGRVDLRGKRVLEMGTASGFLCFYMERQGAEVVAYDLSEKQAWDLVPYSRMDMQKATVNSKEIIRKLNNGWWLGHRAHQSKARVVYGDVYHVPKEIGLVDVSVFGSILLHVRDPFMALENALRLTRETVIVSELAPARLDNDPRMMFKPQFETRQPTTTWWALSPPLVQKFIGVLGFERTELTFHTQKFDGADQKIFTIVGHRTAGAPIQA
jgi:hypothetical protein